MNVYSPHLTLTNFPGSKRSCVNHSHLYLSTVDSYSRVIYNLRIATTPSSLPPIAILYIYIFSLQPLSPLPEWLNTFKLRRK